MGVIGNDEIREFVGVMRRYWIDPNLGGSERNFPSRCFRIRPNGTPRAPCDPATGGSLTTSTSALIVRRSSHLWHRAAQLDGTLQPRFAPAKESGATTTYDLLGIPSPRLAEMIEVCLPYVDYFMPNYEESIMISGLKDRRDILRYFLDRGARHVVLKLGAGGSCVGFYDGGRLQEIRTASFKVPVVDSTGCGDAYNAGFIKGLSLGWSLEEASRLASLGRLTIQGLGSDAGIVDFRTNDGIYFAFRNPAAAKLNARRFNESVTHEIKFRAT
jgi:hypothetical protein